MRKLLFTAIIALVSFTAMSQSDIRFGLTFSPQMAWLKIDNSQMENQGGKIGFNYGLLFDFYLNDIERYAFSTGLIISHTGGKYGIEVDSLTSIDRNLRLQYLQIPLTLRLRTNEIGYMTYYGQFGFAPGVNIRSREDRTITIGGDSSTDENFNSDDINVVNIALYLSAGLEYSLSESTSILAGVFFNNGFTNVVNDDDSDKISINNIGLKLGVLF